MSPGALYAALGGRAAELFSQALMFLLLPRLLGANDFGAVAVVLGLVAFGSSVAAVGGPTLLSRNVAAAPPADRASLARALLLHGLRWRLTALVGAILMAAIVAALRPDVAPPVAVACGAAALVLTAIGTWSAFVALGLGHVAAWSYRYAVQNLGTVAAVAVGYSLFGLDGALAGVAIGAAVGLGWPSWRAGYVLRAPRVPAPEGTRRLVAWLTVSGLAGQVAQRLLVPLAGLAAGAVQAGNAAIGLGIAWAAIYTVTHPFAAALPEVLGRGERPERVEAALVSLGWRALLVAGGGALLAAFLGPPVVAVLLGEGFGPAADVLGLALAAIPLAVAGAVQAQVAAVRLRLRERALATVCGAVVSLALCGALAGSVGADAAAIGLLGWSVTVVVVGRLTLPGVGSDRLILAALAVSSGVLGIAVAG